MKKIFFLSFFLIYTPIFSQNQGETAHSEQVNSQSLLRIENYEELKNPVSAPKKLWKNRSNNFISWADTDIRYNKELPVNMDQARETIHLSGWKGERLNAQLIVSAYKSPLEVSLEVSDLNHNNLKEYKIDKGNITAAFVRYVMTDELNKDGQGACGPRISADFDSTLVADPIDHISKTLTVPENTTRPVWVEVNIPRNIKEGTYRGIIKIKNEENLIKKLHLEIEVSERQLPKPEDWIFHLDLWQNPYAAARYYQTDLWSREHFEFMKRDLRLYLKAGGKSITASIMNRPWNGQTYDPYKSMITWRKTIDDKWEFDFDAFDKWVEFMMKLGVKKQINCYSMVPWRLSFNYFDEASNSMQTIETKPGEKAYSDMWGAMLRAFASHLKKKGWFNKTYISMDERPMEVMVETIKLIKSADKNFKISFAGSKHPELMEKIEDYCLTLGENFPGEILDKRKKEGKISTFYTSCAHPRPNSFTFSPPTETEWYGWYAAANNLDGYLRWAYSSWPSDPLLDSRFITWAAGDTFFIYPGGRSSIRFQKLIEGIQAYEKIQILKKEFKEEGNKKNIAELDSVLDDFSLEKFEKNGAEKTIKEAKKILNSF